MSRIKRWIEEQLDQGIDVLHLEQLDKEYCYYSGLPSPAAYQNEDQDENETRNYSETA
jgi:hypothetical protein